MQVMGLQCGRPEERGDAAARAPAVNLVLADALESPKTLRFAVPDHREHLWQASVDHPPRAVRDGDVHVMLQPGRGETARLPDVLHAADVTVQVDESEVEPRALLDHRYGPARVP